MKPQRKILALTSENLRVLIALNGFRSVTQLAQRLGCHRTTVHNALRKPSRFGKAHAAITAALTIREVPHA
jgi:DNA-binding Lrp family transcriptional regulator